MPPRLAFLLVVFCIALNAAGFVFHLFELFRFTTSWRTS
jgi:hypothetical protein